MDELHIQKLDFAKSGIIKTHTRPAPTTMSRSKKRKFFTPKRLKILGALVLIFVLVTVFFGVKTYAIYNDAKRTYAQAKVAMAAAKMQNVILAKEELVKTQKEILTLKKDIDSIGVVGFVPFLGGYYNDVRHLVNAGTHGVQAAIITTDSVIPYADVLGLKGDKSFVAGSAQDRIRLAVKTLGKVVPKIDDIEKEMTAAKAEVDPVNPNRYPNFWVFKKARTQIAMIKDLTDQGVQAVNEGKPLIKVLPQLLGESEAKRYLILFQNDKELRPTGGFITYYAIFKVEEGVVSVDRSSNIYDLDDSIPSHPAAPRIIRDYLPKVNQWYIRDTNLSPDFKQSVDDFNSFYKRSSQYQEVDGVIAIDTHFLVHVLDVLGEVQAEGLTFNSTIDPRCDCPQAVYVLEDNVSRPVNYIKANRKSLLGELLYATMQKALSSSPKEYWGRLVQAGITDATNKHVLFYLYNQDAQKGIEALNWGGRIRPFEGDYMHFNDANLGGAKSNLFVRHTVKVEYDVKNGEINKKVTLNYKNPHKYSDCNLESGGLCLNATLRNFQRFYVPENSTLTTSRGSQVKVKTNKEFGKTYYESFFYVNPLGIAQMSYSYKLPFTVKSGEPMPLLIQKQPGTDPIPYEIYVNGKKVESFDLIADKELALEL